MAHAENVSRGPLEGRKLAGTVSARMNIDGREYINFYGSGYLALARVPQIREAVKNALAEGVPFSQQVPAAAYGAADALFDSVEQAAAEASGTEASVYFSSGYFIGSVALASLEGSFDLILLDESAHYSLADAALLSGVPVHRYAHCDANAVRDVLKKVAGASVRPLLVTDGVFAVTGRVPPLADYAAALSGYGGRLLIDEAHSFGVLGARGRGAAEHCAVEHIATSGATLSKAYCAQGAIVGCSTQVARRLRGIPQIRGACAGSPLSAAAAAASLRYATEHPEIREKLLKLTDYLRVQLKKMGMDVVDSPAPIVAFRMGGYREMQAMQRRIFEQGIHILHATNYVGCGSDGMLRCSVFADHSTQDIDALIGAMR